jgi:hypothetical protein
MVALLVLTAGAGVPFFQRQIIKGIATIGFGGQ